MDGEDRGTNERFKGVERASVERLGQIVPTDIPVPERLAERTCEKIWETVDQAEAAAATLADEIFSPDTVLPNMLPGRLVPKIPRIAKNDEKSSPFILKRIRPIFGESEGEKTPRRSSSRRRNSCRLVNGEICDDMRDEYYWETLPTENSLPRPKKFSASAKTAAVVQGDGTEGEKKSNLVDSVSLLGRTTIHCVDAAGDWLGVRYNENHPPEEFPRPTVRRVRGGPSDLLLSIIGGVLIATVVVFPLLRLAGYELFLVIAKSQVRKIGESVSETHIESELYPLWSLSSLLSPKASVEETTNRILNESEPSDESSDESSDEPQSESP